MMSRARRWIVAAAIASAAAAAWSCGDGRTGTVSIGGLPIIEDEPPDDPPPPRNVPPDIDTTDYHK